MKDEKDKELDRRLFDLGRIVLGKDCGGMVAKLKNELGSDGAWNALKGAHGLSDPREYIGAILRRREEIRPARSDVDIEAALARYQERRKREGWL